MSTPSICSAPGEWVVAALYQFLTLEDPARLKDDLYVLGNKLGLCGTLIIAPEGINGTVAGSRDAVTELQGALLAYGFDNLEYKESISQHRPFRRFKVRLKKEIVTLGVPTQPLKRVGHYVEPEQWNTLLNDPDVVVVDTRNRYEVEIGSFQGAVNPMIDSFREFPKWVGDYLADSKGRKIAMFCTGGIRCEKSTSLLLEMGFSDVYHLRGGILKYLEQVPLEESRWRGECFVFDERVAVDHGLQAGKTLQPTASNKEAEQQ